MKIKSDNSKSTHVTHELSSLLTADRGRECQVHSVPRFPGCVSKQLDLWRNSLSTILVTDLRRQTWPIMSFPRGFAVRVSHFHNSPSHRMTAFPQGMNPAAPHEAKGQRLLIVRMTRALKAGCTVGVLTFLHKAVSSEESNFFIFFLPRGIVTENSPEAALAMWGSLTYIINI